METSVQMPLDADGFLRRECPGCLRKFKWFYGETAERPNDVVDPDEYFCPYCGSAAPTDQWWTQEQLDYAVSEASPEITRQAERMIRTEVDKINRRSSFIELEVETSPSLTPPPLVEMNDMVMLASPCHDWEPIKVDESWAEALHCLVCGSTFRV